MLPPSRAISDACASALMKRSVCATTSSTDTPTAATCVATCWIPLPIASIDASRVFDGGGQSLFVRRRKRLKQLSHRTGGVEPRGLQSERRASALHRRGQATGGRDRDVVCVVETLQRRSAFAAPICDRVIAGIERAELDDSVLDRAHLLVSNREFFEQLLADFRLRGARHLVAQALGVRALLLDFGGVLGDVRVVRREQDVLLAAHLVENGGLNLGRLCAPARPGDEVGAGRRQLVELDVGHAARDHGKNDDGAKGARQLCPDRESHWLTPSISTQNCLRTRDDDESRPAIRRSRRRIRAAGARRSAAFSAASSAGRVGGRPGNNDGRGIVRTPRRPPTNLSYINDLGPRWLMKNEWPGPLERYFSWPKRYYCTPRHYYRGRLPIHIGSQL